MSAAEPPRANTTGPDVLVRAAHSTAPRSTTAMPAAQYTSVRFTKTLLLAGLVPSVGTVGDAASGTDPRGTMLPVSNAQSLRAELGPLCRQR